jgi:hypothetical protein
MTENLNNTSVIEDIDLSLYKFGLIHKQNINNYLVTNKQKKFQKFKPYASTIILFLIIIRLFFNLKFYKNPNYPLFYYDLFNYFGGLPQYQFALCFSVIVLSMRLIYLFNYSDENHYKWLDIIKVLKSLQSMDSIGLDNKEYESFVQRIKFYKLLTDRSLKVSIYFNIFFDITLAFLVFNTIQSLIFGILNALFHCLWITYILGVQLYGFLFYFIVCHYIRTRFKILNNKISRKSKLSVVKLAASIIREHNNICNDILEYDKFWKSFFFALTYTIIPTNLMLLQQLLFDDIMPTTIVIYSLFAIIYLISHIVLNLVSASVNKNASKSHKFLFGFQTKFLSSINIKQNIKIQNKKNLTKI